MLACKGECRKINLEKYVGIFCVMTTFSVISYFLGNLVERLPTNLQNTIELMLGVLVFILFIGMAISSYLVFDSAYKTLNEKIPKEIAAKVQLMKWVPMMSYTLGSMMYFLYIVFNYGAKQTHVSAIGFSLFEMCNVISFAFALYVLMWALSIIKKQ